MSEDSKKSSGGKNDFRFWLGRLVEAEHEARLRVLEDYDQASSAKNLQVSSPAASSTSPLDEAVATIPADVWKGPTSKGSFWIFSDSAEAAKLVTLLKSAPKQTLATTHYKFVLSGEGRFVNRWASNK